jgi:hypothetical protein
VGRGGARRKKCKEGQIKKKYFKKIKILIFYKERELGKIFLPSPASATRCGFDFFFFLRAFGLWMSFIFLILVNFFFKEKVEYFRLQI